MIDRKRRNQYAEQLRHFAAGILTVEEYEARTEDLAFDTQDAALNAVWRAAWCLYDDFRTDRLRGEWALDTAARRQVARMILFLYSDAEYRWPEDIRLDIIGCLVSGVGSLLNKVTLGLCRSVFDPFLYHRWKEHQRWMRQFGDLECWPFLERGEFEAALQKPRFFVGISH